jgi:hypothetical protein
MNKEMKTSKRFTGSPAHFLIPALCLSTALTASGATLTWDGGASPGSGANWSANTSWKNTSGVDPAAPAGASDVATFASAANNVATVDGDFTVLALTLSPLAGPTVSTTLNASGGIRTITVLGGSSNFRYDLTLNGVKLKKTVSNVFSLNGGLTTLTLNNGASFEIAASGAAGQINTAANRTITSTSGNGSVEVVSGATFNISAGSATATIDTPVSFTSAGTLNINQGTLDLKGTSTLGGTVDFNGVTAASQATLINNGAMTANNLTVNRSGSNTPLLQNAGGTLTFAGSLVLNAPVSVTGGTVQGVTSSASGAGDVSVSGTGTLSPAGSGVGTLRLPDQLTFTGGTYAVNIHYGTGSDQLIAGGAVALGDGLANLSVTSENVAEGTVFTILSGSSLTGTFAGLAEGGTVNGGAQSYTVNYTGTGVNLTAVPEPQFYAGAVGLGLLGFTVWRRNQKRA